MINLKCRLEEAMIAVPIVRLKPKNNNVTGNKSKNRG